MIHEETEWSSAARTAAQKRADTWNQFFGTEAEETRSLELVAEAAPVVEVKEEHEEELLARDNVVGVAASVKVKGGKPTGKPALIVFVEEKKPKSKLSRAALVPAEIGGVPTDVVAVGVIRPLLFTARVRPPLPGYSIGHHNITAGTFGCLVRDIRRCRCKHDHDCCCGPVREECPGDYLILSNNHVLADSNRGLAGDLILQPGPFDGGVFPADGIATLERFEPIVFGRSGYNLVDAAVARPTHSRNVTAAIIGQVVPRAVDQAFVGQQVIKAGRTTQVTVGRVLAVDATIVVSGYPGGAAQFRQQIVTTAMSAGGDSGSLLMDSNLNAVGLLFAGSAEITIHNHIANVEVALGVRPVTAPTFG